MSGFIAFFKKKSRIFKWDIYRWIVLVFVWIGYSRRGVIEATVLTLVIAVIWYWWVEVKSKSK